MRSTFSAALFDISTQSKGVIHHFRKKECFNDVAKVKDYILNNRPHFG